MKTHLLSLLGITLLASHSQAVTVLLEDFEDSTLTYTPSLADSLGDAANRDYYGRFGPGVSTPLPTGVNYSNIQGSGFYAAEDTNGATVPTSSFSLSWIGLDISNLSNLEFSFLVAEDDDGSSQDWDGDTSFIIEYQIDGGGYQNLLAIASEEDVNGRQTDQIPRIDTDFDGIGDGAEITDTFSQFNQDILGSGSLLDLRARFSNLTAGDEDLAIDNIQITGDSAPIPEPSSSLALGALLALACGLRRGRR